MSEETNCFQASLYFDNIKIGDVRNDGRGGSTDVYLDSADKAKSDKHRIAIMTAKKEVVDMLELANTDFNPAMEDIVNTLFEQWLTDEYGRKLKKIIETKSPNHLIFEDANENILTIKLGPSIEAWLKQNPTRVKEIILEKFAEGAKLLNYNVPETFYK